MKHTFFLILTIFTCKHALACGHFGRTYAPEQYYTFRVCGKNMEGMNLHNLTQDTQKQIEDNCLCWSKITSAKIPLHDIKDVVYCWDYEQLKQLHICVNNGTTALKNNTFANWLIKHKDTEITSYLLLAKRCEITRKKQSSEWYYSVDGDDENIALTDILKQAKEYHSRRLLGRYSLQMIRCLISMGQYNECLNVWMERQHCFQEKVISNMAKGYVAGAFFHVGEIEKAKRMFVEMGDISSYIFCLKIEGEGKSCNELELLMQLYKREINNNRILPLLQYLIHQTEDTRHYISAQDNISILNKLAVDAAKEAASQYKAAWYYTASYTYDKLGNKEMALEFIKNAEKYKANQDLKDAIHVFHIYLTAKYATQYNSDFENYLYNELIWLNNKITFNLDSTITISAESQRDGFSQYYWNDMMRKIVISQVVPKCIASGYKVRALQFLNYADNCIWGIKRNINNRDIVYEQVLYEEKQYNYNCYDYRNDFFINLDSMGVKYIKRLAHRMKKPLCGLDRFLNKHSYNDMSYLYEIIGTQLIAEMKYKEAIQYLIQVPDSFIRTRNIYSEFEYDAFNDNTIRKQLGLSYKLDFAKKMSALEKMIKVAQNPNDRAEYMLTYARGLKNSIERCWKLTSYYRGIWYYYPFYSQYQTFLRNNIAKQFNRIKNQAFQLFLDPERAADALYKWNMYETAITKYPDTKIAQYMRGHCDEWADYKNTRQKPEI